MNIILMGIQGSGKSTQGNMLVKKFDLAYLSSGHIFREIAKEKTPWARYVKETLSAGILIPDDKTVKIVEEYLNNPNYKKGYILDGFPRTVAQARAFKQKVDYVFYIKVSDKEALWRLAYRNEMRDDDTLKAIKKRIELFHKFTEPVLTYYRRRHLLHEINGEQSIAAVHRDIMKVLNEMATKLHIAIDGPVAAGKGTVASPVARALGILYVETGAMYRAVALLGMREKIDLKNATGLRSLLRTHSLKLQASKENPGNCQVFLDDEDVTEKIRTPEVSQGASIVATLPEIREYLVEKQKAIALNESVVMEGRDIGSVVLPNAKIKVFLTADPAIRAKRRQSQQAEKGITQSFEEIVEETKRRDEIDMNRASNPLRVSKGATVVDTTNLTIDQVVDTIISLAGGK